MELMTPGGYGLISGALRRLDSPATRCFAAPPGLTSPKRRVLGLENGTAPYQTKVESWYNINPDILKICWTWPFYIVFTNLCSGEYWILANTPEGIQLFGIGSATLTGDI